MNNPSSLRSEDAAAKSAAGLDNSVVEVRPCTTLEEFEECVRLGLATWGEDTAVPSGVFVVAHHTGGQVLGAFERKGDTGAESMVGFTLAFAGLDRGVPLLHSHMTAVLPTYQNRGVGRRLKLFQRSDALKRGICLVRWTFDPLELKNAHFNLVRLGAVARSFIANCYGITESPLHAGLPTDRLLAEWHLDSERVKSILADDPLPATGNPIRVSLPKNVGEIKSKDSAAGAEIQSRIRGEFQRWFARGYAATDLEVNDDTTDYILHLAADIPGVNLSEKSDLHGTQDEPRVEHGKSHDEQGRV